MENSRGRFEAGSGFCARIPLWTGRAHCGKFAPIIPGASASAQGVAFMAQLLPILIFFAVLLLLNKTTFGRFD